MRLSKHSYSYGCLYIVKLHGTVLDHHRVPPFPASSTSTPHHAQPPPHPHLLGTPSLLQRLVVSTRCSNVRAPLLCSVQPGQNYLSLTLHVLYAVLYKRTMYEYMYHMGRLQHQKSMACMLFCISGPRTRGRKHSTRYLVLFTVQYSTHTRTVWCSTVYANMRVLKILHLCAVYPGWCRMLNAVGGGASRAQRGSGTNC